jgi:hypothetical protein
VAGVLKAADRQLTRFLTTKTLNGRTTRSIAPVFLIYTAFAAIMGKPRIWRHKYAVDTGPNPTARGSKMKHLNLELEKLEQRIAPGMMNASDAGDPHTGGGSGGTKGGSTGTGGTGTGGTGTGTTGTGTGTTGTGTGTSGTGTGTSGTGTGTSGTSGTNSGGTNSGGTNSGGTNSGGTNSGPGNGGGNGGGHGGGPR